MSTTWAQALAWRMRQHFLEPVADVSVAGVVRRLGAVSAKSESAAELAVGLRRTQHRPGDVARALEQGRLVKVFAFRGGVHYLAPDDGGAYLALRASGRQWELPSWQDYYQLTPETWPSFREAVRYALADGPLTIRELGAAVTGKAAFRHLRPVFDEGAGTLVKPLTWQGDMAFGPSRNGQATFQRLDASPAWAGVWDLDEAGPYAVESYVRAYGPATADHVRYWLGSGLSAGGRRLDRWLADLGERLAPIDVDGTNAYVLAEHVDDLVATRPTDAVRLLPGHDQWVMGPGTKDEHVVPPEHRTAVTRAANLVVAGGVVSGTWSVTRDEVSVAWLAPRESPSQRQPSRRLFEAEVARLAEVLDRPLSLAPMT